MKHSHDRTLYRRTILGGVAGTGLTALAGCLDDEEVPDPVTIGEVTCEECGMVITHHPGPSGHAFYEEDIPEHREPGEPAYFCASTCAYTWIFDQEDQGHTPQVLYLTDYSAVDWEVSEEVGVTYISAHLEAEAHSREEDLVLVINSDLIGAMGPAMIPFSDEGDAESFTKEYGGEIIAPDDVSRDLLGALS